MASEKGAYEAILINRHMQNVTGQFVIIIWLPTECMFFFIIETYWKGDETNENIAVVGNKIKVPKLGLV
ncbi:hypothetical protein IKE_05949 [Bacillus cereus VD196]|uniref:Uncharacterized protein n=1 Tax=Bacillus cereus VD196 TaxID=1053243 RepID=A0A9W5PYA6_BACCE|nr:hypothetical protein IKG_05954 [Bacillus cereus VD200]EOO60749.1 hypothetical protein IKE_05949 [Bacillus cereus VD196]